jgi:putative SOS response-associated peptidase YedK
MCGRYVLVQKLEAIEKRFNVSAPEGLEYEPSYNVSPGQNSLVITSDQPKELQSFQFGLTPHWAKKPMYLFNARAEGDNNKENDINYKGSKGIINKPSFRKPIRSRRCLVIADAFIEGTTKEKLNKPHVVYLINNQRPFAFAGIWDEWSNKETGEIVNSFSIITTVTNELLGRLPHHRSPVILPRELENRWLRDDLPLADATAMLRPFPGELMNAYPIATDIKNPRAEGKDLLQPVGQRLAPEREFGIRDDLELQGMGYYKGRKD